MTWRLTHSPQKFAALGNVRTCIAQQMEVSCFSSSLTVQPDLSEYTIRLHKHSLRNAEIGSSNSGRLGAVNRDGTLIGMEINSALSIVGPSFNSVEILGSLNGGFGFSPVLDILFAVDVATDEVVAFDTNTFVELDRYAIGENIEDASTFAVGIMSFSGDGRRLFLSTPSGIRMLDVQGIPEPSSAMLVGFMAFSLLRMRSVRRATKGVRQN